MLHNSAKQMLNSLYHFGQLTKTQMCLLYPELPEQKINQNLAYMVSTRRVREYTGGYFQPISEKTTASKSYELEDCLWAVMENLKEEGKLPEEFENMVEPSKAPASYIHQKGESIYYTCYLKSEIGAWFLKDYLEKKIESGYPAKALIVLKEDMNIPEIKCPVLCLKVNYPEGRGTCPVVESV